MVTGLDMTEHAVEFIEVVTRTPFVSSEDLSGHGKGLFLLGL